MSSSKILSIIVATHNGRERIEKCLNSIQNIRDLCKVEVIIKDSGHNLEIENTVSMYSNYFDIKLNTRPDSGIYDAWNIALELACGDWILFLGDDDELIYKDIVKFLEIRSSNDAFIYGQVIKRINLKGKERIDGEPWEKLKKAFYTLNGIPHQAMFHHKKVFEKAKFNTDYRIAADYEFLLKSFREFGTPVYINLIFSRMSFGGVSTDYSSSIEVMKEFYKVHKNTENSYDKKKFVFAVFKSVIKLMISKFK